ncbi:DNA-binding transcriptional regulator DsdC [Pseudomonas sp. 148P]|uniref:DNA-binding transcriptional regulator DsdC n=1 Tax=Pseudomonas ulcerans TaxID=3115852 RepID=A0ABU7HWG9_9PSED|nr:MULTISPECIES: DNA-binding transcriptional regulator DsdC [unclassified Pseudomonas]MEE1924667.1 DNA-binding transcriptional regulator DsdC [Pseudomonas sp. 147P]MEE1935819.1 DNA-binding transcriptional regulator DsdC [Pseudomonas sp. 148P]
MLNLPPLLASRLGSSQFANLHTFLVAARHLSFALAAEELCLTPSAVSHRIARLEQALSLRLFERLTRRIRLTADGERIYSILRDTVAALDDALRPQGAGIAGAVVLYAHPSIASDWLVPRLADFHQRYPEIALDLRVGNERLDFRSHSIDLALVYAHGEYPGLVNERLMDEAATPVCSPAYAKQFALFEAPRNLRQCTLLHDALAWEHAAFDAEWREWARRHGLEDVLPARRMTFDRSDLCASAAVNGVGIAMGRRRLVRRYLEAGALVAPFGDFAELGDCAYWLVYPPERALSTQAGVLQEWLRGQAETGGRP